VKDLSEASAEAMPTKIMDVEKMKIIESLERNHNNRRLVAEELGMSERTLYRRLEKYGLVK